MERFFGEIFGYGFTGRRGSSLYDLAKGKTDKKKFLDAFVVDFEKRGKVYKDDIKTVLSQSFDRGSPCLICASSIVIKCVPYGPYARCHKHHIYSLPFFLMTLCVICDNIVIQALQLLLKISLMILEETKRNLLLA